MSDEPTAIQVRLAITQMAFGMGVSSVHEIDTLVKYTMTGELPVEDCPPPIAERVTILEQRVARLDEMAQPRYRGEPVGRVQSARNNQWDQ